MPDTTPRIQSLGHCDSESISTLGGKAVSLDELATADFPVPDGFVVPTDTYRAFLDRMDLQDDLSSVVSNVDVEDDEVLQSAADRAQAAIYEATVPPTIVEEIEAAYDEFQGDDPFVAVRSSATAEDLPEASFAGQQETFLNVDRERLIDAIKDCWASLYTARAIAYRAENGVASNGLAIAVVVQRMVDADKSGVLFTREPSTGENRTVVEAAWGLGEAVVSGSVTPDTYVLDPEGGVRDVRVAEKETFFERDGETGRTIERDLPPDRRERRVLSDDELSRLAAIGDRIEAYYDAPQDIEWAIESGEFYVLQSRAITTISGDSPAGDQPTGDQQRLCEGLAGSPGTGGGTARVLSTSDECDRVEDGAVIVTEMTSPDMMPAIRRAAGIVTDEGGMTSHAAIVARELGVPAVLGTSNATDAIEDGDLVTVDGDRGVVYAGDRDASDAEPDSTPDTRTRSPVTATSIKVNVSLPAAARRAAAADVDGVGLMRTEHFVLSLGKTPAQYIADEGPEAYTERLVDGLGQVAEAFYPRPVRVRTLDAPTDEFRELEGGADEPVEHNPMLGYRGIRRSLKEPDVFEHELSAFAALYDRGYDNVEIMFPLVADAQDVATLRERLRGVGIDPTARRWGVMVETPASALCLSDIVEEGIHFLSFGTNDLTQYVLAVDRNNERVADRYDETHPAVTQLLEEATTVAREHGVDVGICGEAASRPAMIEHLVEHGVTSLSVNVDAIDTVRRHTERVEKRMLLDRARTDR
jgi:pyruvate,water dikinase